MTREIRVDAHVDATKGIMLLSTKQVPGFVRRIKLRSGRKNDLHRMMRIFRAEAEARLLQRAQKYPRHCPTAGVSRLGRSK